MTQKHILQRALEFLRARQLADGSFMSYASPQFQPFTANKQQATGFTTILILDALHNVAEAADICGRAAGAVRAQQTVQGSWNYWQQHSQAYQIEPYPDDLDDTACATAALTRHDPDYADGGCLGSLARLLIASEQASGGPYNTWLVDCRRAPEWQDIDVAVNANISYALSLVGVRPAGLQRYLEAAIMAGDYHSSYYIGNGPLLYFLARAYRGPASDQLRQAIKAAIAAAPTEPLTLALLLSAGCRAGLARQYLRPLVTRLLLTIGRAGYWPAAALYVDPVYDNQLHYNGSDALTTALVLEALTAYQLARTRLVPDVARSSLPRLTLGRGYLQAIDNTDLRRSYRASLKAIVTSGSGQQIAQAATLVADSAGWPVAKATLANLNLGSLNGWLAYTIYDDFLDGDGRAELLSVANLGLRRSYDHFVRAVPGNDYFRQLVITAFDAMDSANAWELKHARAVVAGNIIRLGKLPNYGQLEQLAQRSWGHSLAASGVVLSNWSSDHPGFQALQVFFRHFLIARQLNDDAHDWEDDLRSGRLSVVVSWLLADLGRRAPLNLNAEISGLRHCFWATTIEQVVRVMQSHLALAHNALADLQPYFADVSALASWLASIEQAATLAISGRDNTVHFLQAYGAPAS